jgi:branched-chain amino acid aminotransferase
VFKIKQIAQSAISKVDFNNLAFGNIFTDHYFTADCIDGVWTNEQIIPLEPMALHPASFVLHYGQSIFEGLKAEVNPDGLPILFRPEKNAERFAISAERMALPVVPQELFMNAITELIKVDKAWIPKGIEGASMYIRPFLFGTDPILGVKIGNSFKFVVIIGPAGVYYSEPVNVLIQDQYVRAFAGGTGHAKAAGNYAATLAPVREAKEKGFEQILWTDGSEEKNFQEIGTMNIFFVIDNVVITPALDSATILPGVTRDSILKLAQHLGYKTEERSINVSELLAAYESGSLQDMFGTGTAAVVYPINSFGYKDKHYPLNTVADRTISTKLKSELVGIKMGTKPDIFNWTVVVK